ncbi:beta-hexosaminidase subunit alpha isoform X2 [Rhipicephalus microplus]|uniref:beta-hexosaminidase subunit alpha isoform X2 n=1 Tax=Rhipicephalus microplus TaxID=6941 RepID=UPI0018896139|nr:beta-hexosaminidase subunit alpha-like [Rhipicephalus microplus]
MFQTTGPNVILLDPRTFSFVFVGSAGGCDVTDRALRRYRTHLLFNDCAPTGGVSGSLRWTPRRNHSVGVPVADISSLLIHLRGPCEHTPHHDMDESYSLQLSAKAQPSLTADSVWGVLRGLETFSQIVYPYDGTKFAVNETTIHDAPRFKHRGLLIDTSRHFIPLKKVVETLDAMTYNKMNVLHWHITDDQSFPFVSRTFPSLSEKGAFDPETHVYKPADVQYIIDEATTRGIRVMAEFDTPGHTRSWGEAYPELLTTCYEGGVPNGRLGPIDPTRNQTYAFLAHFFAEVARVFPEQYLHLGGDEVDFLCWISNPNVTSFMRQMGFPRRFDKLEDYYIQRLLEIVKVLRKSCMVWQEVFDNKVQITQDTIVHVWKQPQELEMASVTSAGYKVLLSACWYLDHISYGTNWKKYYACDPEDFPGTPQQKALVLGGEACVWGEFIDSTNLISRTWPRASAAAERLWSPATVKSAEEAEPRLEEHRCRMLRRGLAVEPQNGPGYCTCDGVI